MRLKMLLHAVGAVPDLVLICIDQIDIFRSDQLPRLKQRIRRDQVIMVHKADKPAPRCLDGRVRVRRDPPVFSKRKNADPLIALRRIFQYKAHLLFFRTGVGDAQLIIAENLIPDARKEFLQESVGRSVCRYENGKQRTIRRFLIFLAEDPSLFLQGTLTRFVCLVPRSVGDLVRCHSLTHTNQEVLRSIMFQVPESLPNIIGLQFLKQ